MDENIAPAERQFENPHGIDTATPTKTEIKEFIEFIKSLKKSKAAVPGIRPAEIFKVDPNLLSDLLRPIIGTSWNNAKITDRCKDG